MKRNTAPSRTLAAPVAAALLVLGLAGCRTPAPYVWVDAFDPPPAPPPDYLVQPGDLLTVRVLGQDGVSARVRVRPDGMISVPVAGEVKAAGAGPGAVARTIEQRLLEFYQAPSVSVAVEETRPLQVHVLGEVIKPGAITLEAGQGVLHALSLAGGLTPFAERDWIVVLRRLPGDEAPTRIRFDYVRLTTARGRAAAFRLAPGDVLVVE